MNTWLKKAHIVISAAALLSSGIAYGAEEPQAPKVASPTSVVVEPAIPAAGTWARTIQEKYNLIPLSAREGMEGYFAHVSKHSLDNVRGLSNWCLTAENDEKVYGGIGVLNLLVFGHCFILGFVESAACCCCMVFSCAAVAPDSREVIKSKWHKLVQPKSSEKKE